MVSVPFSNFVVLEESLKRFFTYWCKEKEHGKKKRIAFLSEKEKIE